MLKKPYLCTKSSAMRANEIRGELMMLLAYINETESLEHIKTFVQGYLPASQHPENLTEAQRQTLLQSIAESEDESLLVSEAEANQIFSKWRE